MAEKTKKKSAVSSAKKINTPAKKLKPNSEILSNFTKFPPLKSKKTMLAIIIISAGVLILLYVSKSLFITSLVNGEPISRLSVIQALEKQGGKSALESIIIKKLITQEARAKNISIEQKDIDLEIKKISDNLQKQSSSLDQALTAQGMTREQLNEDIRINLYIQKMVGDVTVTDKEIDEFIKTNASQIPDDKTDDQIRKQATEQLKQEKLQLETQKFVKSLQDKAKIINFVQY